MSFSGTCYLKSFVRMKTTHLGLPYSRALLRRSLENNVKGYAETHRDSLL